MITTSRLRTETGECGERRLHHRKDGSVLWVVPRAGPVQARLVDAFSYLHRIRPDAIPNEELRQSFAGVMNALTAGQAQGGEASIVATLKNTSDEDASAIGRRILDLYLRLKELLRDDG